MSKQITVAMAGAGILCLCGWVLAQQAQPAAKKADGESPRYMVSPAADGAVLLETSTGKTWVLHRSGAARGISAYWLPAIRLEGADDLIRFQNEEEARQSMEAARQANFELEAARKRVTPNKKP
jgi:hypothetical protein